MWYLKCEDLIFYQRGDRSNSYVGRVPDGCDLVLNSDTSVSRRHALLKLESGNLILQDLGSKYGTFVNENIESKTPLRPNEAVQLKCNDNVRFGCLNNIWTVQYTPMITCTSTLKGENLEVMKTDLEFIGASLRSDWDETCTHLTMPAITLTAKVLAALAFGKHIVTVDYWKEWRKVLESGGNQPDATEYLPEVIESTLNKESVSFSPDNRRTKIFSGKKFIFFSRKQMNFYKMVLERCGAIVGLLSECKLTKSKLCDDDVIVVQYSGTLAGQESQSQRQVINDIISYMNEKSQRVIPEVEIGLAVLLMSTEQYCNPKKNFLQIFNRESSEKKLNVNILAPETEDITLGHKDNSGVVINESLTSVNKDDAYCKISADAEETGSRNKRKLSCDSPTFGNISKKKNIHEDTSTDDGMFAFVEDEQPTTSSSKKSPIKELNFLKPKNNTNSNLEDDIFNFLPDSQDRESTSTDITSANNSNLLLSIGAKRKAEIELEAPTAKKMNIEKPKYMKDYDFKFDISALLKNTFWKTCSADMVKEEIIKEERDESKLDMGTTIVNVRNDLIVKCEMPEIQNNISVRSGPNFKTFKKVLPLKMQICVIQSYSKNPGRGIDETVDSVSSDDEEMRNWMEEIKKSKKRIR